MLTIQFRDSSFCEAFYEQFQHSISTYGGVENTIIIERNGEHTNLCINFFEIVGDEEDKRKQFASVLTNITIKQMFPVWIEEWLRSDFHYKDIYEIEAIIEHARDIFFNMKGTIPLKTDFLNWQKEMFHLFEEFIKDSMKFSIDSFLRFRLRESREKLLEVVEKAIDEYKFEHEYQIMVNTCREFLQLNDPRIHTIHLYLDHEIRINDSYGKEISNQDIRKWLVHDLCFEAPLPIAERVVGPLVSIAPKKLVIHCRKHHEGLVQTLLTIFEERVVVIEEEKSGDFKHPGYIFKL